MPRIPFYLVCFACAGSILARTSLPASRRLGSLPSEVPAAKSNAASKQNGTAAVSPPVEKQSDAPGNSGNSNKPSQNNPKQTEAEPDTNALSPVEQGTDAPGNSENSEKPSTDNPKQIGLAPKNDIQVLIWKFTEEREAILRKQQAEKKALSDQLKTVTGRSREELIADFREKHRAWLLEQKALREELRERLKTMRDEFKNRERDQLLDEVKESIQDQRVRIGQD